MSLRVDLFAAICRYRQVVRKCLGFTLGGVLLTVLAGCTVQTNGDTGVSVDDAGNLIVVLAWCGRSPDVVVIYHDRTSSDTSSDPSVTDAVYTAPALEDQFASFRLDAPSDGWSVSKPFTADPAITYTVYGGTNDNSRSTSSVRFELGDAAKLKPGMVLVPEYDDKKGEAVDAVISLEQFKRDAQDPKNCG